MHESLYLIFVMRWVVVPLLILMKSKQSFPDIWLTPTREDYKYSSEYNGSGQRCNRALYLRRHFIKKLFLCQVLELRSGFFTLCTIFGRMPGIEPELLRPKPGVLQLSDTHP